MIHDFSTSHRNNLDGLPNHSPKRLLTDIQIYAPDVQGDTGANCCATNQCRFIWHFQTIDPPINIGTFQATDDNQGHLQATGKGIIKVITNNNSILTCPVIYAPQSSGTILSPDDIMIDNNFTRFEHGGFSSGQGYI